MVGTRDMLIAIASRDTNEAGTRKPRQATKDSLDKEDTMSCGHAIENIEEITISPAFAVGYLIGLLCPVQALLKTVPKNQHLRRASLLRSAVRIRGFEREDIAR